MGRNVRPFVDLPFAQAMMRKNRPSRHTTKFGIADAHRRLFSVWHIRFRAEAIP